MAYQKFVVGFWVAYQIRINVWSWTPRPAVCCVYSFPAPATWVQKIGYDNVGKAWNTYPVCCHFHNSIVFTHIPRTWAASTRGTEERGVMVTASSGPSRLPTWRAFWRTTLTYPGNMDKVATKFWVAQVFGTGSLCSLLYLRACFNTPAQKLVVNWLYVYACP